MTKSKFFQMTIDHAITLVLVALVVGSLALSVFFFNTMPEKMTTHWDSEGNPNGYSSKTIALFTFPALLGLITTLYFLLPNIDPLKKNFKHFEKQFGNFMILISSFFVLIQMFIISWNRGVQVDVNIIIPIAVGIILFYSGILIKHAKRNFFVGIKTPWTLSSDYVWDKTHKLGSVLFRIAGVLIVFATLFQKFMTAIILVSVISVTIITVLYPYFVYRKEEKQKKISRKKTSKKKSVSKTN